VAKDGINAVAPPWAMTFGGQRRVAWMRVSRLPTLERPTSPLQIPLDQVHRPCTLESDVTEVNSYLDQGSAANACSTRCSRP
jgi:hypothetical protein